MSFFFTWLIAAFAIHKLFDIVRYHLPIIDLNYWANGVLLRKSFPTPMSCRVLVIFSMWCVLRSWMIINCFVVKKMVKHFLRNSLGIILLLLEFLLPWQNTMAKNKLGRKQFISLYSCSILSRKVRAGTQHRNLEAGTVVEAIECFLLTWFSMFALPVFL